MPDDINCTMMHTLYAKWVSDLFSWSICIQQTRWPHASNLMAKKIASLCYCEAAQLFRDASDLFHFQHSWHSRRCLPAAIAEDAKLLRLTVWWNMSPNIPPISMGNGPSFSRRRSDAETGCGRVFDLGEVGGRLTDSEKLWWYLGSVVFFGSRGQEIVHLHNSLAACSASDSVLAQR